MFLAWLTWISPGLHLNLRIIWHLEAPVSLHSTNVLQSQSDLSWLGAILDWQLAKVPRELGQQILHVASLVSIISIVESALILSQWQQEILVHLCEHEALPQVSNGHLVIPHISQSQQWIVSLASDLDLVLLYEALTLIVGDSRRMFLLPERLTQLLAHLLSSDAHQTGVELKSTARLERDVDLLLGLGIDHALVVVKLEAFVEDFLDAVSAFLGG